MSKLSEYSKFDHLDEDDASSEEEERLAQDSTFRPQHQPQPEPSITTSSSISATAAAADEGGSTAPAPPTTTTVMRRHPTHAQRFIFEHAKKPIYEWEQTLSEVILYIPAPPEGSSIVCTIAANHLQLGLRGHNRLFLDEDTAGAVDTTESTWCIEESDDADDDATGQRKIVIYLQKVAKGSVWSSALRGGAAEAQLDPVSLQRVQKEIMLERFQEENPGMDFRDAEINGSIPDPRTFMGGVRYD